MRRIILSLLIVLVWAVSTRGATSVTHFGITWTFSEDRPTGLFASGEPWVKGPVTITSITPDVSSGLNGWQVNPVVSSKQGFHPGYAPNYDASLVPALPYTALKDCSIVKTIGIPGRTAYNVSHIKTAAVLTVLMSEPPDGGAGYFRPPYIGSAKPLFAVADLDTSLLPSLAPVEAMPSLGWFESIFSLGLRMDHNSSTPRIIKPEDSFVKLSGESDTYQPRVLVPVTHAMLRLMQNDSIEDKMPLLILLTQHCIDRAYAVLGGYRHPSIGGHNPGHRLMAGWAAVLLNMEDVLAKLAEPGIDSFHEDRFISKPGAVAIWGDITADSETQYWNHLRSGGSSGSKSSGDPYGFIDGGRQSTTGTFGAGSPYQTLTAQNIKAIALCIELMPALKQSMRDSQWPIYREYAQRWVEHGVWTLPDPAAPYTSAGVYEVDYGPDPLGPGPILGAGRYPAVHGLNANGGENRTSYVDEMYAAYWDTEEEPAPQPAATRGRIRRGAKLLTLP